MNLNKSFYYNISMKELENIAHVTHVSTTDHLVSQVSDSHILLTHKNPFRGPFGPTIHVLHQNFEKVPKTTQNVLKTVDNH